MFCTVFKRERRESAFGRTRRYAAIVRSRSSAIEAPLNECPIGDWTEAGAACPYVCASAWPGRRHSAHDRIGEICGSSIRVFHARIQSTRDIGDPECGGSSLHGP